MVSLRSLYCQVVVILFAFFFLLPSPPFFLTWQRKRIKKQVSFLKLHTLWGVINEHFFCLSFLELTKDPHPQHQNPVQEPNWPKIHTPTPIRLTLWKLQLQLLSLLTLIYLVCMSMHTCTHVSVSAQFLGSEFFSSTTQVLGSNLACWAWWQVPLLTEPSW